MFQHKLWTLSHVWAVFPSPKVEIDSPYIMVYLQQPWQDTQTQLFI